VPLSPRELDVYGAVTDPTDWQHWWELNQDRFLSRERLGTASVRSSDDDFYLGAGQQNQGRTDDSTAQAAAQRAIVHVLKEGGPRARTEAAFLAAIDSRDSLVRQCMRFGVELQLAKGDAHSASTAVFALGATGDAESIELLTRIAQDDEAARAMRKDATLDERIRAFAATGLGLAAGASDNAAVRQKAIETLARIIDDEDTPPAVRKGALVGFGLVPLALATDTSICYCGDCVREQPGASFQAQVGYLAEHVIADRDYDPPTRAEAVTALGRLVGARLNTIPDDVKRGVVSMLHRVLDGRSRQTEIVRESAILALGLIGDADASHEDAWVRWALRRAARSGSDMERRFALMSLALTGGRKGQSATPWAATNEVRSELRGHLDKGLGGVRPWAALALGVLGHDLRRAGQATDSTVDAALEAQLRRARRSERGAHALAIGLRGASQCATSLSDVFEHERDESARSYAALALGLAEVRGATKALEAVLFAPEALPLLRVRSGIALGLLKNESVVPRLVAELETPLAEARLHATIATLAQLFDPRGSDALAELVTGTERTRSMRVQEEALRALGRNIEPRARQWRAVLAHGANYRAVERGKPEAFGSVVLEVR